MRIDARFGRRLLQVMNRALKVMGEPPAAKHSVTMLILSVRTDNRGRNVGGIAYTVDCSCGHDGLPLIHDVAQAVGVCFEAAMAQGISREDLLRLALVCVDEAEERTEGRADALLQSIKLEVSDEVPDGGEDECRYSGDGG